MLSLSRVLVHYNFHSQCAGFFCIQLAGGLHLSAGSGICQIRPRDNLSRLLLGVTALKTSGAALGRLVSASRGSRQLNFLLENAVYIYVYIREPWPQKRQVMVLFCSVFGKSHIFYIYNMYQFPRDFSDEETRETQDGKSETQGGDRENSVGRRFPQFLWRPILKTRPGVPPCLDVQRRLHTGNSTQARRFLNPHFVDHPFRKLLARGT